MWNCDDRAALNRRNGEEDDPAASTEGETAFALVRGCTQQLDRNIDAIADAVVVGLMGNVMALTLLVSRESRKVFETSRLAVSYANQHFPAGSPARAVPRRVMSCLNGALRFTHKIKREVYSISRVYKQAFEKSTQGRKHKDSSNIDHR